MNNMLRLFVAIELPPAVREALRSAQVGLKEARLPVRWVNPEGAHLTLKFLGPTRPEQVPAISAALADAARAHRPFELETAGLGCFPDVRAPRVVWLGLADAVQALGALRDDVERLIAPLGFPTEQRPFSPHLTLGRTSKDATRQDVARIGPLITATHVPPAIHWRVGSISLMRADLGPAGPRYTRLASARLDLPGSSAIIQAADEPDVPPDP
jgi:2'-5' RNA ligase